MGARFLLLLIVFSAVDWVQAPAEPALSFLPVNAEPLGHTPAGALVLHDNWQMREEALCGNDGPMFSKPGFAASGWYDTTVPATALAVLVRHGVYPDPYVGTNMMRIPDMSDAHNARYDLAKYSHLPDHANPWAKPYWFRTEFIAPESFQGKIMWLHLDGIDYRADVWVNGTQVGRASDVVGMFRRFEFDVSRLVQPGQKAALAVRVFPPDIPGDPLYEQLDGLAGKFGPNAGDGAILRNVCEYATIGWDWIPAVRDRNIGIWQHVWLEATGRVAVRDPAAFTEVRLPQGDQASVTVRGFLDNSAPMAVRVSVQVRIEPIDFDGEPISFQTEIDAPAGRSEFVLKPEDHPELIMQHPHLWWPVTYGSQPLYRLTVSASVVGPAGAGQGSEVSSLMGVRTVGSSIGPGGGRAFTVNGRVIRLTGGAWVPDLLLTADAQRYRDEMRLLAAGNQTLVRMNGCAIMPPDCFYDACDREGLLVWQDFSRTSINGHVPVPEADPAVLMDNMKDVIARLRAHPSVLVWCACNEDFPQEDFGRPLQDDVLPAMDGTRPFLCASGRDASWEKEPIKTWSGGPYAFVPLKKYFALYAGGKDFASKNEIGVASPPPINTIARYLPDWNEPDPASAPLNRTSGFHDATDTAFRATDHAIRQMMDGAAGLDDYLWAGDLFNAASYRAIYEAANKARPLNAGTTLWKVNSSWPSYMWQVIDWTLRPNAGYYAMKEACRPLHLQESEDDQGLQVVSTLAEDRPGLRLQVTLQSPEGNLEATDTRTVDVPADATTRAGALPPLADDGRLHFLALDLFDATGASLDHQVKWIQRDGDWRGLMKLAIVPVEARLLSSTVEKGEDVLRFHLANTGKSPAVDVWLQVLQGREGWEVLPSFWDDNGLTLLPGEERDLTVRFRAPPTGPVCLMVEGWNVPPRELDLAGGKEIPLVLELNDARLADDRRSVRVVAIQHDATGPRLTTWPVPLLIDGVLARTVRIAAQAGSPTPTDIPLPPLPAGAHTCTVGDAPPIPFTAPPGP